MTSFHTAAAVGTTAVKELASATAPPASTTASLHQEPHETNSYRREPSRHGESSGGDGGFRFTRKHEQTGGLVQRAEGELRLPPDTEISRQFANLDLAETQFQHQISLDAGRQRESFFGVDEARGANADAALILGARGNERDKQKKGNVHFQDEGQKKNESSPRMPRPMQEFVPDSTTDLRQRVQSAVRIHPASDAQTIPMNAGLLASLAERQYYDDEQKRLREASPNTRPQ